MTTGDGFASLNALAIANMPYMLFSARSVFVVPKTPGPLKSRAMNLSPSWNRFSESVVALGSFCTPSKTICTRPDGVSAMQFDHAQLRPP